MQHVFGCLPFAANAQANTKKLSRGKTIDLPERRVILVAGEDQQLNEASARRIGFVDDQLCQV